MKKKSTLTLLFLLGLFSFENSFAQNNALNLDGADDYINLDALAPNLANSATFTIEFQMKADLNAQSSGIQTTLFAINPSTSNSNGLLLILGGTSSQEGKLMVYDEGASTTSPDFVSDDVIGDNSCHHIAYVRNGTTGTIFIDGENVGAHSSNFNLSSTDRYSLGQEWDNLTTTLDESQFYNGFFEELRIWNTARTEAEIQANKDGQLIGNEVGLLAYYNFDQGSAGANNAGLTSVTDLTANGLNGTLINFQLDGNASNWVELSCDSSPNPPPPPPGPIDPIAPYMFCDSVIVTIPNVFTPNGDEINDLFETGCDFGKIQIFNRWGETVFDAEQIGKGWNGNTTDGKECAEGTYFYLLEIPESTGVKEYQGFLTLIR